MKILVDNVEFTFHFERFIQECKDIITSHYSSKFPSLDAPKVCISEGGKYLKVYKQERNGNNNSSVWFFVDGAGDIWKPASWAAPAKNFPRGNIIQDSAPDVIAVYGI